MNRQEVLNHLSALGAAVSYPTLGRYARLELIPQPDLERLGRGKGTRSTYAERAVFEAAAATWLLGQSLTTLGWPEARMSFKDESGRVVEFPRRRITAADLRAARRAFYELTEDDRKIIAAGEAVILPPNPTGEVTGEQLFIVIVTNLWADARRQAERSFREGMDSEFARRAGHMAAWSQRAERFIELMR